MKKVISLVMCVVILLCCGCFAGCNNQSADNQSRNYSKAEGNGSSYLESSTSSEAENTLAKEFIKKDNKEIAKTIYNKLMSEYIYCEYGQSDGSDNVVYFKNSGYKLEDRSWIEVSETKKIIFYNPDSDYLKTYFNRLVPFWDDQTKGKDIIDELTSTTYENDDGYRYNIIKKNGVEYHIYYYLKESYKIHNIYVVFDNDGQSSK